MRRLRRVAVAALVLLAVAGCGSSQNRRGPSKANFVLAADRICNSHLELVLAWLERLPARHDWQQVAVQDAGIHDIIARTIRRLEALGPAPGPHAGAFGGYVKTLKARAALYRLTSMADLQQDRPFLRRLHRALVEINGTGDDAAHRYGLQICGANLRDLARKFA